DAIKSAHITMNIGEDDHIPRKVAAEMTIEPKGSGEKVDVEFELTLSKVNEKQTIKAPAGAESIEKLFEKLGVNPFELLGAMEGGGVGDLGSLLEGIGGSSGEAESAEELELPSVENSKEF